MLLLADIFTLRIVDIIDILLFAILLYEIYNLVKGTGAIRIFLGIISIYIIWKVVKALHMQLLGEILGQFISVGFIVLIIVFQPELRQFLLMLGNTRIIRSQRKKWFFLNFRSENPVKMSIDKIVHACKRMADSRTGALIVITQKNELASVVETGEVLDAQISEPLLESIFFRNSPLHDGAVVIVGGQIRAARCILPVSNNPSIPAKLGLRHRAAVGLTEKSDAIAVVVSEERGQISYSYEGKINTNVSPSHLNDFLGQIFKN